MSQAGNSVPSVAVTVEGLRFHVHPEGDARGQDEGILAEVVTDDCYLLSTLAAVQLDEPIRIVVDVGAHIGAFAVLARHIWPSCRLVAIEPNPDVALLCQRSLAANPGGPARVVSAAVAYGVDHVVLRTHAGGNFATIARPDADAEDERALRYDPERYLAGAKVPAVTLESAIQLSGGERIDLLKLDCEGAEIDILQHAPDALLQRVRFILGEYHHGPDRVLALLDERLPEHQIAYMPVAGSCGNFVAAPQGSPWISSWLQAAVLWSVERRQHLERQHALREAVLDRVYRIQFRLGRLPLTRQLLALRRWIRHRR